MDGWGRKTDVWSSYRNAGVEVTYKISPELKIVAPTRILRCSNQKSREQKSSNWFFERYLIWPTWIFGTLIVYIEEYRIAGLLAVRSHDLEIVRPFEIAIFDEIIQPLITPTRLGETVTLDPYLFRMDSCSYTMKDRSAKAAYAQVGCLSSCQRSCYWLEGLKCLAM